VQARLVVSRNRALRDIDPERDGLAPISERIRSLAQARVTEGLQGGIVETLGRGDVMDADRDMIDHGLLPG
jgi:hypothetical protein